jgi:hypothetical protein
MGKLVLLADERTERSCAACCIRDFFSAPYPKRNTIGVKELWGGAQVGFDVGAVEAGLTPRCFSVILKVWKEV